MNAITTQEKRYIAQQRAIGVKFAVIAARLGRTEGAVRTAFCRMKASEKEEIQKTMIPEKTTRHCRFCGIEMEDAATSSFCSSKCRYDWYNHKKRDVLYHLTCEHCGVDFNAFGNPNRRFCSRRCAAAHSKELKIMEDFP